MISFRRHLHTLVAFSVLEQKASIQPVKVSRCRKMFTTSLGRHLSKISAHALRACLPGTQVAAPAVFLMPPCLTTRHASPTTGPLDWLFPLPGLLFPQSVSWLTPLPPSSLWSDIIFLVRFTLPLPMSPYLVLL